MTTIVTITFPQDSFGTDNKSYARAYCNFVEKLVEDNFDVECECKTGLLIGTRIICGDPDYNEREIYDFVSALAWNRFVQLSKNQMLELGWDGQE